MKNILQNKPFLYALALLLGILCGYSNNQLINEIVHLIAQVFIRFFQCISLPIISLSIIVTLAESGTSKVPQGMLKKTLKYTFSTTLIAASLSCVLYVIINPPATLDAHEIIKNPQQFSYLSHIINIIPRSVITPFLQQQIISVLLLSIITGFAIRFIPDILVQQNITSWFHGLHAIFLVIINWLIKIIPIGMIGFIAITVQQLKGGMALQGLGKYLLIIVLANILQGTIILPGLLKLNGLSPLRTFKAILPALSVAFFSKSSVGTLPVTMHTAESRLGIDHKISRFIFPLCTSLNMNGCAAFIFTTVIYLMHNHGITPSIATMILWIVIATISAIGNAGVPMGCFFLSASLLSSMNISITLMGIILPFYGLIDMLETALNVWSDTCIVSVIQQQQRI